MHNIPSLKVLDYQRIKSQERVAASQYFGSEEGKKLNESLTSNSTFEAGQPAEAAKTGPTPEELALIKIQIENSSSLDEIARLEKALKSGNLDKVLKRQKVDISEQTEEADAMEQ